MIGRRLERYPYLLAYPARLLDLARDPNELLERGGQFVELSAVTLGVLALGWCTSRGLGASVVAEWETAVDGKGMALGKWTSMLRSASRVMAEQPTDPLARNIRLAADGALPRLEGFVPTRNSHAHGGKPRTRGDVAKAAAEIAARVVAILEAVEPLQRVNVGVVRSCEPASLGSHIVDVDVATGYAELFPAQRLPASRLQEVGKVVAYGDGGLDFGVDLTPYCRWEVCPRCGRDELFYLTKRKKNRSDHFSFSTGHELRIKGAAVQPSHAAVTPLGMQPLGSRRHAAAHGWRSSWADLAPPAVRVTARAVDSVLALAAATLGWLVTAPALGLPTPWVVITCATLGAAYEPTMALFGGPFGKRLLRIEPVSVWNSQPLGQADSLRRAFFADLQLLFPPLAVRNLAWLMWDPARQCLHDRKAASIVVAGRSQPGQKR